MADLLRPATLTFEEDPSRRPFRFETFSMNAMILKHSNSLANVSILRNFVWRRLVHHKKTPSCTRSECGVTCIEETIDDGFCLSTSTSRLGSLLTEVESQKLVHHLASTCTKRALLVEELVDVVLPDVGEEIAYFCLRFMNLECASARLVVYDEALHPKTRRGKVGVLGVAKVRIGRLHIVMLRCTSAAT